MTVLDQNLDTFGQVGTDIGGIIQRIQRLEQNQPVVSSSNARAGATNLCRSPLKIIIDNYLDYSTMTVTPSVWDTLPLDNVLIPDRSLPMMTKARTEHVIYIDFDRPRLVNAFACPYHSLSQWGKFRIELFREPAQSGELKYDSGFFLARQRKRLRELKPYVDSWWATYGKDLPPSSAHYFDSTLASSARITIYDQPLEGLDDWFDIGMLFLGLSWQPQFKNFAYGLNIEFEDDVAQVRSAGKGQIAEGTSDKFRVSTLNLKYLIEEDANLLFEFVRKVGKLKPFFISAYPRYSNRVREVEHAFVARFTTTPARAHVDEDQYSTELRLGEI